MKKIVPALLSVILILVLAVSAFAESGGSSKISTSGTATYQLSYPADTVIPWESENYGIGTVTASKLLLEPNKKVSVTVASSNSGKLVKSGDPTKSINYTLSGADSMNFESGQTALSYPLAVNISLSEWHSAYSGEYSDTLTFTAEYVNK